MDKEIKDENTKPKKVKKPQFKISPDYLIDNENGIKKLY